jgi:hypothetical protein
MGAKAVVTTEQFFAICLLVGCTRLSLKMKVSCGLPRPLQANAVTSEAGHIVSRSFAFIERRFVNTPFQIAVTPSYRLLPHILSRDSAVGIATGYTRTASRKPQQRQNFFLFHVVQTDYGMVWVPGALSPGVKRTTTEVKNMWIFTFHPPPNTSKCRNN